jgi:hypothetical protein
VCSDPDEWSRKFQLLQVKEFAPRHLYILIYLYQDLSRQKKSATEIPDR